MVYQDGSLENFGGWKVARYWSLSNDRHVGIGISARVDSSAY